MIDGPPPLSWVKPGKARPRILIGDSCDTEGTDRSSAPSRARSETIRNPDLLTGMIGEARPPIAS